MPAKPSRLAVLLPVLAMGLLEAAAALDPAKDPADYVSRTWQVPEGLPQATVTGLAQTPDGYLWVSTFGGLARFDGFEFRRAGAGSDLSPRLLTLAAGSGGELWAIGESGGLWRVAGVDQVERVPAFDHLRVRTVLRERNGALWVGTASDGVFRMTAGDTKQLTMADGLPSDDVLALCEGPDGTIWLGTLRGLCRWRDGRLEPLAGRFGLPAVATTILLARADGTIVAGVRRSGVWSITSDRATPLPVAAELAADDMAAIVEDRHGNLWVGGTHGLYRVTRGHTHRIAAGDQLANHYIRSLLEDADGNLWVGTNGGGLAVFRDGPVKVYGKREGFPAVQVSAVLTDRDGATLVALNCGPVMRLAGGVASPLAPGLEELNECGWGLLRASDGALWYGAWGAGLARIAGGRAVRVSLQQGGRPADVVVALFERRNGEIWAGTPGGACRIGDPMPLCLSTRDGLVHNDVRYFAETSEGVLWIATSGGVSRWDGRRFTNLTTADGLFSSLVRALYVDRDDSVWVGTYGGGLAVVRGGKVAAIDHRNGLLDDVVSWITEDDDGFFWLTGNRGIFRIARADLLAVAEGRLSRVYPAWFGTEDGLESVECNGGFQPAGARTPDGRLWFPTMQGLAAIDPKALPRRPPRRAAIEGVKADGRAVAFHAGVTLPPDVRSLEIHYSGLDLAAAGRLIFRYRLEGIDADWVDAGRRRDAYYGSLPSGRFRFEVQAFSPDGGWGPVSEALDVTVRRVYWRSPWFIGWSALAFATLVLSLGVWRQAMRSRHEREHAEIARRLTAGVLHEFRQPLQVLQTRLEIEALRAGRGVAGEQRDEALKALDRLAELLVKLERLQTGPPLRTKSYGGSEKIADLDGEQRRT